MRSLHADSQHVPVSGALSSCSNWPGMSPAVDVARRGQMSYYGASDMVPLAGSGNSSMLIMGAAPLTSFWTELQTSSDDYATAVAADSLDRAFIVGYTDGDFGPYTNSGGTDALVRAFLPEQSVTDIWSTLIGTAGDDRATEVAADFNDDVLVGGWLNPEPGLNELFIAKLDGADGTELWRTQLGPTGDVGVSGLVTDSQGNVYAAGQYGAAGTEQHAFVAKLASDGQLLWLELFAADAISTTDLELWSSDQLVVAGVTDAGASYFIAFFER